MGGWRIFWNARPRNGYADRGDVLMLESRTYISEGEAKRLVRQLITEGHPVISLRRPDTSRIIKGDELRNWAYSG